VGTPPPQGGSAPLPPSYSVQLQKELVLPGYLYRMCYLIHFYWFLLLLLMEPPPNPLQTLLLPR
jgi:hypothetical protein